MASRNPLINNSENENSYDPEIKCIILEIVKALSLDANYIDISYQLNTDLIDGLKELDKLMKSILDNLHLFYTLRFASTKARTYGEENKRNTKETLTLLDQNKNQVAHILNNLKFSAICKIIELETSDVDAEKIYHSTKRLVALLYNKYNDELLCPRELGKTPMLTEYYSNQASEYINFSHFLMFKIFNYIEHFDSTHKVVLSLKAVIALVFANNLFDMSHQIDYIFKNKQFDDAEDKALAEGEFDYVKYHLVKNLKVGKLYSGYRDWHGPRIVISNRIYNTYLADDKLKAYFEKLNVPSQIVDRIQVAGIDLSYLALQMKYDENISRDQDFEILKGLQRVANGLSFKKENNDDNLLQPHNSESSAEAENKSNAEQQEMEVKKQAEKFDFIKLFDEDLTHIGNNRIYLPHDAQSIMANYENNVITLLNDLKKQLKEVLEHTDNQDVKAVIDDINLEIMPNKKNKLELAIKLPSNQKITAIELFKSIISAKTILESSVDSEASQSSFILRKGARK